MKEDVGTTTNPIETEAAEKSALQTLILAYVFVGGIIVLLLADPIAQLLGLPPVSALLG